MTQLTTHDNQPSLAAQRQDLAKKETGFKTNESRNNVSAHSTSSVTLTRDTNVKEVRKKSGNRLQNEFLFGSRAGGNKRRSGSEEMMFLVSDCVILLHGSEWLKAQYLHAGSQSSLCRGKEGKPRQCKIPIRFMFDGHDSQRFRDPVAQAEQIGCHIHGIQ